MTAMGTFYDQRAIMQAVFDRFNSTTPYDVKGSATVRDGAAKGKVERFFRTVRDQFLLQKLDLSSLGKPQSPVPPVG